MLLINDTYDLICLILGIIGTTLCVYQFYLAGWDVDELLFGHTSDNDKNESDT